VPSGETNGRFLTTDETRHLFDRIGRFQDWQVYEARAIQELVPLAAFDDGEHAIECGDYYHGLTRIASLLLLVDERIQVGGSA
jgi:hypothetical protein